MSSLRRALGLLGPYWPQATGALLSLFAVSAASLVSPRLLEWTIDDGIQAGDLQVIELAAAGIVLVALVRGVARFLQGYLSEAASQGVAYDMRNEIYAKLQHLSFSYHDTAQTGQLLTRVTSDVEMVRQFVGMGFLQFLSALVLLIGSGALLLHMNWRLALAALTVTPFVFGAMGVFMSLVHPRFTLIQERLGALNTILQENIAGARVVRAFAAEGHEAQRYSKANNDLLTVWLGVIKLFASSFPLVFFLANVGTLIVFWIGGHMVIDGSLTVGQLVAFNAYLAMLLMPLFLLGGISAMVSRAGASAERVFEVIDAEVEVQDRPGAHKLGSIQGYVEFEDVHFRYVGSEREVLKGVSFAAEPGQKVAILGRTGSGKSTIINLIPRFYDVTSGRVTIDGHDVRDVTLESLRKRIGMVLQDPVLFSGSVRDNIAYGRPEASDAEVERAARAAQAEEFLKELPDGLDTNIGERGVRLSGGQKQRVAIARAVLVDPRILVFDDSTSAVDTETEQRIHEALEGLRAGRTSFVIAQRISTVLTADLILVLEEGRIVASGTHDTLLATSPLYAEIVASQLVEDAAAVSLTLGQLADGGRG